MRLQQGLVVLVAVTYSLISQLDRAEALVIYESANAAPQSAWRGGPVLVSSQFVGVRFEVTSTVIVEEIGGIFVSGANNIPGSVFGAIVALSSSTDFPDSNVLSTPDVLGAAVIPTLGGWPGAEVMGALSLTLDPGWYAMVFGGGLFGAYPQGGAVTGQYDIGSPSYFFRNLNGGYFNNGFQGVRMVVSGQSQVIPEPSTFAIWSLLALCGIGIGWRRRRKA